MARPKGVPNKLSAHVRKNFSLAFDKIGGLEEFCEWAKENRTDFYKLYSKLLPTEVTVHDGETAIERVLEKLSDTELENAVATLAGLASGDTKGTGETTTPEKPTNIH